MNLLPTDIFGGFSNFSAGSILAVNQQQMMQYNLGQSLQEAAMRQQYAPCKHTNCPVCFKEVEDKIKLVQQESERLTNKKEEYRKRCEDYMVKFHERDK